MEICERPGRATSALGLIDDVNLLAYGTSTKENVKTLERVHGQCEVWSRRHGSTFAPKKYELIHLARNPEKFHMAATITIGEPKAPEADIRKLGIQIDTKLKWHLLESSAKMSQQNYGGAEQLAVLADTPGSQKNQWMSSLTGEVADARPPCQPPPWV